MHSTGEGNRRWTVHWVNAALLGLLWVGSAYLWPALPDRIPAHFGADGAVTRWVSPSFASWFAMPLVASTIVAINYGLVKLLPRWPHLINMPGKEQLMSLPPERQAPVLERMYDFLYGVSTMIIVLFGFIQWMTYRTAFGADSQPFVLVVLLMSALMTPLILALWLPALQRELRRQVKADEAEREASRSG